MLADYHWTEASVGLGRYENLVTKRFTSRWQSHLAWPRVVTFFLVRVVL